jgi:DNA-directed RNA polymerase subunit K/omega
MLMREEDVRTSQALDDEHNGDEAAQPEGAVVEPQAPAEPAAPITNRFLFVNVAGRRAKQLRRGAKPRFEPRDDERLPLPKAERTAMEEVRRGLVHWQMPEWHGVQELEFETPRTSRSKRR